MNDICRKILHIIFVGMSSSTQSLASTKYPGCTWQAVSFSGDSHGTYLSVPSHPIAIYACPIPWDSHYIIIILILNTIKLKLLNL